MKFGPKRGKRTPPEKIPPRPWMAPPQRRFWKEPVLWVFLCLAVVSWTKAPFLHAAPKATRISSPSPSSFPLPDSAPPQANGVSPSFDRIADGKFIENRQSYQFHYTVDPILQASIEEVFRAHKPPYSAFVALNLFLFYIFWEAMLIPMYFIIGIWGGPRRIYAAVKFFLYTLFGSLLMLVAILYIYFLHMQQFGFYSFDLFDLYRCHLAFGAERLLFLAFGLSFAIKVPMFPFHTWLPDAHVEAPTAGSVILAGVLLKMGTYGFLRFSMPLFPEATAYFYPLIAVLALIGIIYGALVAMVQPDVKKLVAYSSVSHLGFVMLGLAVLNVPGVEGSVLQMVNHGLSTGALFIIVGMIYDRRHTRLISDFGGLSKAMPVYAAFFMIVTLSSIGLPGLNGFVGEFLILLGTFKKSAGLAVLAASGVILAAVYMLWMFQRAMFGPLDKEENKSLKDLNVREIATLVPIVVMIVWIGIYPQTFLRKMDRSVEGFLRRAGQVTAPPVQHFEEESFFMTETFSARELWGQGHGN